jgi:predicted MFS family arabinose efflux permease
MAPLVAATITAIAGTAMFNLSPLFLAAAAAEHGIGDRQLGLLMSLEVAGIALASFLTLLLIDRLGARRLAVIGGTVIFAGNLLAYLATDFTTLLAIRFLVGLLGDGLAFTAAIVVLAGIFAFTINLGAVWGFSERLGTAAGLDAEQVGFYLSLAIAFQALGSFTAAALSRFRHRQNLLIVVLLIQGCALYLTGSATSVIHFAAGIALWGLSWNFGMAVMLGQLAQRSDGRKLLALVPGTDALGAAAGPATVSLLTLLPLHWAVVVPAAVGGLLAIALFIRLGRQPRQAPPEPA